MERRHAEPWLQTRAAAPELLPSTFKAGAGGDAAELSQWLRSQHRPGCDAQDTHSTGTAANELCVLADSSRRNPPCTRGAPTEDGHLLPFGTDGGQVAARARLWSRAPLLL